MAARVGTALHKGFIRPVANVGGEVSLRKPSDVIPYGRYGTGLGNEDAPLREIKGHQFFGIQAEP